MYQRLKTGDNQLNVEVICNSTQFFSNKKYETGALKVRRIGYPSVTRVLPPRLAHALKIYFEFVQAIFIFFRAKPDLIHIVGYSGATMAAIVYFKLKKKPRLIELVTKEASPLQCLPGFWYPKLLGLRRQTVIVAISEHIREACVKIGFQKNVWCRPNPVDVSRFSYKSNSRLVKKKSSLLAGTEVTVGMLAKFMPQKNQIFLLEVLSNLPSKFRLLLAGPLVKDGIHKDRDIQYYNKITLRIAELGLQSRVSLIPEFTNGPEFYQKCDIFTLPQFTEGLATPMLEALSFGIPVVANRAEPAFCEWVIDGRNGFLRDLDARQWAESIQAVSKFSNEQRVASAKKIIEAVKASRIDRQYLKIFDGLASANFDTEVDVENLLEGSANEKE